MDEANELLTISTALAAAAEAGRWDEVSRNLWLREDALDGLREGGADREVLAAAIQAGDQAVTAVRRLRAELETETHNLRAARRSAESWRPYREASGGTLDVSS